MIEQSQEEALSIIKEIEANPSATQRAVSEKLGISLGKTNYLLRELIHRGIIKGGSFSANPGKVKKISYLLTPKGFEAKLRLTYHFLKIKEAEYNLLKEEWEKSQGEGILK
ncbi:MAG: MarR family EPS-associated transcriptional regulator [Candidatus Omnitrophota bacterium]|jgi:EPS-associated MarR family transcriptional regulator|nr:MarR family EPS-associated transcriptional regulator [Candidatus Omnitrophota bacterium]